MLPVLGERTVMQFGKDIWGSLRTRGSQARTTIAGQLNRDTLTLRRDQVKTALQRDNLNASAQSLKTTLQRRAVQVREGLKPENLRTTFQNHFSASGRVCSNIFRSVVYPSQPV